MIRLFVGVPLPNALATRLESLGGGIPGARWVAARNLHLTLRFIGEVDEDVAEDLLHRLQSLRAPAFDIQMRDFGTFGGRKPRALWAGLEINAALAMAILYGVVATRPRDIVQSLSAAIVEGIRAVAPVLWLMMGIGMVVTVLMADSVTGAVAPLLSRAVPSGAVGYVLVFGLLSPLALYRGPLNLYGMGAGLGAMLKGALGGPLVGGALMGSGLVQGVCDPTNTHNAWAASFAGCDVNDVLRATLPYAWVANLLALIWIRVANG